MNDQIHATDLTLIPFDNRRLVNLCGRFDEHLRLIERRLGIEIINRGNEFQLLGPDQAIQIAAEVLKSLYHATGQGVELNPTQVHLSLQQFSSEFKHKEHTREHSKEHTKYKDPEKGHSTSKKEMNTKEANTKKRNTEESDSSSLSDKDPFPSSEKDKTPILKTRTGEIHLRSPNQEKYIENILTHDINFGIGPAGTGKTFLAVACAVAALEQDKIRRILLVRPAVEAGERLGFLPGDLSQKIDPYLRPLYDALYEILGFERVTKLLERQVIEIASLAYMRGRTLNDAYIILDESQNTTVEQMKMFLTRIGFSSTAVITGDITQIDLPKGKLSGLKQVMGILQNVEGISFTYFRSSDVVRHPVVQRIIDAYEEYDKRFDSKFEKYSEKNPEKYSNTRPIEDSQKDKKPGDPGDSGDYRT